jgi:hypothetical protein
MPKTTTGKVPPPKSRTSGQSAHPGDEKSLHGETDKTADMVRDTVDPGEAMTGNQGVKISDDQNSLKAGGRGLLGTCEYIQEFRDDVFDKPDDPAAPFVEAIEIVTGRETEGKAAQA